MDNNKEIENRIKSRRKEFACQICKILEATIKMESGSLKISGNFCQPCAVVRLEKWAVWNEGLEREIRLKRGSELMGVEVGLMRKELGK